jgi:hypothetical protein
MITVAVLGVIGVLVKTTGGLSVGDGNITGTGVSVEARSVSVAFAVSVGSSGGGHISPAAHAGCSIRNITTAIKAIAVTKPTKTFISFSFCNNMKLFYS